MRHRGSKKRATENTQQIAFKANVFGIICQIKPEAAYWKYHIKEPEPLPKQIF